MTYGDLKFRMVKAFPGVDLSLIEGWCDDVYGDILDEIPWQRLNVHSALQTVAPYVTGTLTLTNGSTTVTGVGTTFTSAMSGRGLRVTGRDEIYEFTYTGATTGTLDRAYEGTTGSIGYKIFQYVYVMPADCRVLDDSAFAPLKRIARTSLPENSYAKPTGWASYMDDSSTPPRLQIQFDAIPDAVYSLPFVYGSDIGALTGSTTTLLPWVHHAALVEGVTAKIKAHLKDYVGAAYHEKLSRAGIENMLDSEAQGMAPCEIQLPSYYTSHRRNRWCR